MSIFYLGHYLLYHSLAFVYQCVWSITDTSTIKLIAFTKEFRTFEKLVWITNESLESFLSVTRVSRQTTCKWNLKIKLAYLVLYCLKCFALDNSASNVMSGTQLSRFLFHSTEYGIESITNLVENIWNPITIDIKSVNPLNIFRNKIKKWVPKLCFSGLKNIYYPSSIYRLTSFSKSNNKASLFADNALSSFFP